MRNVEPLIKAPLVAHEQFRHIRYLVCRAGTSGGALGKHILIEIA